MAAAAESMISTLAGPAEGSSESAPAPTPAEAPAPAAAPAQEPSAAAVPAPAAPEGKPAEAPKPSQEQVDQNHLAALREARAEIKSLRQQLEAQPKLTAEDQATLARLRAVEKATTEQEPDFLADPKGYVDTKVAGALKKLDEAQQQTKETADQVKAREQREQTWRATQAAEQQFVATMPDYPQALEHVRTARFSQLQMMAPNATPEQITQHIALEEMNAAAHLLSQGKNPAEFAYNYAKTIGYQPKAPQSAAAPAAAPKASIDKDAVRSLGSGGGDAPSDDPGNSMPELTAALQERFKRPARR